MSPYKSTCSFSNSDEISIFKFLQQFITLPAEESPLSTLFCDIFWMALSTLNTVDSAIPNVFHKDSAERRFRPVAPSSCHPHPKPDDADNKPAQRHYMG